MRFILFALLGSCLLLGLQAETLFEKQLKLAKAGNKYAQAVLGSLYIHGTKGAPKNRKMAAYWMGQAAKQGIPEAQRFLAQMYDFGEGVAKNDKASVYWYRKAAEQGDAVAQLILGAMYANGEKVPEDNKEAVKWYTKAAEQGDAVAQLNLAVMYHKGEGVIENYVAAYAWTIVAKANGADAAEHNLQILKSRMTLEQIAEAEKLAKEIYKRIEANRKD